MEEFRVSNFKYGLDTRREQITAQPGTLVVCENCHINPGAEIEKRKQFAVDGNLAILDSLGDQGTFGLEETSVGLVTFGSALPSSYAYTTANGVATTSIYVENAHPGSGGAGLTLNITAVNGVITGATVNAGGAGYGVNDSVTTTGVSGSGAVFYVATVSAGAVLTVTIFRGSLGGQPLLVSAMPAGYVYQQLQHPAITIDPSLIVNPSYAVLNYDRAKHRITSVKFSNNYNGNAFVAATFSDGNTFLFYNGTIVDNSYDGTMLNSYTTAVGRATYIVYRLATQFMAISGYMAQPSYALASTVPAPPTPVLVAGGGTSYQTYLATPTATTFTLSVTYTTAGSGVLAGRVNLAGVVAASTGSTASFTVAGGGGITYVITAPLAFGSEASVNLVISSGVVWGTSNAATATAIAAAINALTTEHGYSASAVGAVVSVVAPLPSSPATGSYTQGTLVVTSADGTANGNHAFSTVNYHKAINMQGALQVSDTWATNDYWSVACGGSNTFTIGRGNIAAQTYIASMKLGQRMYIAFGSTFAFSAVGDPSLWEEQNTGAGTVAFLSQYGAQDSVKAFSHLQGRLAVFGSQSIQMWTTSANPSTFALIQTLDNSGTVATFSVQALGDYDVYYLDVSGVRSLRTQQVTNNAFVDDVGVAIDLTIRSALVGYDTSGICSIIEPTTRQYWLYLNGVIYVHSNYPSAKVLAWATYKPTYQATNVSQVKNNTAGTLRFYVGDSDDYTKYSSDTTKENVYYDLAAAATQTVARGKQYVLVGPTSGSAPVTADKYAVADNFTGLVTYSAGSTWTTTSNQLSFTPTKFVVHNKQVYVRADDNKVYLYGGADNNTFDNCQATVELPWLDNGNSSTNKKASGLDAAIKGAWQIYTSMNPRATVNTKVMSRGSATSPSITADSTFDTGHYPYSGFGTHFKIRAVSGAYATSAKLAALLFLYEPAQIK